ncbi:UNVERIFIED_CONTAM: GNAT family protein [Halobacillus marinus]|uniref:GNAT family N-acetyltransferase n=1 Tax=Halobacillus sp. BAB-2008 TaxID=1246484 RepID=UPI0002A4F781|nr:GNAT family protein [Halobacillus sp. BAB-2008]ELK47913.1 ribosomal-protein-alanine N-acetyltransferase [Halobacillus sp. BAB-2008]
MGDFPKLVTERLVLREVSDGDAGDMLEYLSDEEVVAHLGLAPSITVADARKEVAWYRKIRKEGTGIRWGVTRREDDKVIGSCGYLHWKKEHYRAEIGFELSRSHWKKGIASEALEAVLDYGFETLGLERVEALIEPDNTASRQMVTRHGFMKEGVLRNYEYTLGKFDDLCIYSILKGDKRLYKR